MLASRQPGVSIASVALANGLNANMLRRWVVEIERVSAVAVGGQGAIAVSATTAGDLPAFVAVQMPAPAAVLFPPDIHIELSCGSTTIVMRWPASQAGACAAWLRLVQSAKLNGHDPWAYLKDVLERLLAHPNNRIDEMLPPRWKPAA